MPKRKRLNVDYGNAVPQEVLEKYLNKWSNNKETESDLKIASLLIRAEGGSLLQILISEDESYNGIFHLVKFKFKTGDINKILVEDLDVLHDARYQDQIGLINQLPEIARKYQGDLSEDIPLSTNPLDIFDTLPKLIME